MASVIQWAALANGDASAREQLLREHISLVHHVARQLSRALAARVDIDEMVSCGTLGLIDALDAYDPQRGLAFSTFAVPRIRGAILDELRRQDHVPRSVRRKTRQISQARETLTRIFGRAVKDAEVAEHLGIDLPTLWKWESDTEGAVQISLSESGDDDDETEGSGVVGVREESSADDELTREQEYTIVREAVKRLREKERTVISLYYFEQLKLHEIAAVLGLTESRVSQIRTSALRKLRETVGNIRVT
jgi:RNA polymerase sigma factor for flagellar operon FliA